MSLNFGPLFNKIFRYFLYLYSFYHDVTFTIVPLRHQLSSFVYEPLLTMKLSFRFLKTIRMLNKLDCLPNFINLNFFFFKFNVEFQILKIGSNLNTKVDLKIIVNRN